VDASIPEVVTWTNLAASRAASPIFSERTCTSKKKGLTFLVRLVLSLEHKFLDTFPRNEHQRQTLRIRTHSVGEKEKDTKNLEARYAYNCHEMINE
jgi:hypothetical protein